MGLKWEVPLADGADPGAGAAVSQLFEGKRSIRVDIFCREDLQNHVDAKLTGSSTVTVKYVWKSIGRRLIQKYFPREFQNRFMKSDTSVLDSDRKERRKAEIKALFESDTFPVLVIEDFGTTGLNGPVNRKNPVKDKSSPYYHPTNSLTCFLRRNGRSGKTDKQLGSAGLGRHVYYKASQISSKLIYTVPIDLSRARADELQQIEPSPLFFAQSFQRELEESRADGTDQTYCNYHHLTAGRDNPANPQSVPLPFGLGDDADVVDAVRSDFELSRTPSDPGTSIVIPFPISSLSPGGVAQVIAREFPLPILRGELRVLLNDQVIDKSTLVDVSDDADVNAFNRFLATTFSMKSDEVISMRIEEVDRIQQRLIPGMSALVEKWKASEPVCVEVQLDMGERGQGSFRISCQKVIGELKGRAQVCRGGLVISEYSDRPFGKRYNAIAYIDPEDNLGMLLRSAEDPAHHKWVPADIYTECPNAERLIRFISRGCDDLVNAIEGQLDEEDLGIFSDVLPAGEGPVTTEPPPPGKSNPFVMSMPSNGTAVIRVAGDYDGPLDVKWKFDLVYDSVNGASRARKSFRLGSFSLLNANLTASGGEIVTKSDNSFVAIIRDKKEFEVEVVGIKFAAWADIRLHAQQDT